MGLSVASSTLTEKTALIRKAVALLDRCHQLTSEYRYTGGYPETMRRKMDDANAMRAESQRLLRLAHGEAFRGRT